MKKLFLISTFFFIGSSILFSEPLKSKQVFKTNKCIENNQTIGGIVKLTKESTVVVEYNTSGWAAKKKKVIGTIIGKDSKHTYIIAAVGENRTPVVRWGDQTSNYAPMTFADLNSHPEKNATRLSLLKFTGNKGKVIPLREKNVAIGAELLTIESSDNFNTFNLKSGKVEGIKDYGKFLVTNLDRSNLASGSPLIDNQGCIAGIFINDYYQTGVISSKQIVKFLELYSRFNQKIKELESKYPLKADDSKWPKNYNDVIRKNQKAKKLYAPYATVKFTNSLSEACNIWEEDSKKLENYELEYEEIYEPLWQDYKQGLITWDEVTEKSEDAHNKKWPYQLKEIRNLVEVLRQVGHDDWQLYSRFDISGVGDLRELNMNTNKWDKEKKKYPDKVLKTLSNFYEMDATWGKRNSVKTICKTIK